MATTVVEPAASLHGSFISSAVAAKKPRAKLKKRGKNKPKITRDLPPLPELTAPPGPAVEPAPRATPPKPTGTKTSAKPISSAIPTATLLAQARALYTNLDYDQVVPLAEAVLARAEATVDQRLDAYLLQGSSLAIIGDSVEAEKPFRFLLRGRPDYEMPNDTSPKILAVFRKVQVEERTISNQLRELERERTVKELELTSTTPQNASGGRPLAFEYRLRDPRGAVSAMEVHYRRNPEEPFSSLALTVNNNGAWRGELPGDWTANERGFTLQYYVTTHDKANNPLLSTGAAVAPLGIAIAPGKVTKAVPAYKTWWFWTATVGATAAIGVSTWLIYKRSTALPETSGRIDLKE